MSSTTRKNLGFVQVKALALAVSNVERAKRFFGETLGLPPETARHLEMAFMIGDVILLRFREKLSEMVPVFLKNFGPSPPCR